MAKTALTQLIEKWESETGSYIPNAPIYKEFIKEAKEFLKIEREEIEKAFEVGNSMGICANSHDYFEEVYK